MFKKKQNNSFSPLFFPLLFSICLLGSNVFAMQEEQGVTRQTVRQMSREQLEELILQQQTTLLEQQRTLTVQESILKGMSAEEIEVLHILNIPLSKKVSMVIDLFSLCKKENLDFLKTLDLVADDSQPIGNKALKQFMQAEIDKPLTIRQLLEDKEIPYRIARSVFRGVLAGTQTDEEKNAKAPLNLSKFRFFNTPETMEDWIIAEFSSPALSKILYEEGSLTDCLISKYLDIRKEGAFITIMGRSKRPSMKHILF